MKLVARCCDGTASLCELEDLYEHDREITFATFARHVDVEEISRDLSYAVGREQGLKLKDDYAMTFNSSRFRGRRCYHLEWSAIDHIFQ